MKLYDHLNNLTRNKEFPNFELDEVSKSYDPYMISRFFSMFEAWMPIVELVNEHKLPKDVHYRFFFNMLPQASVSFKNYIKKTKNELVEEQRQLLFQYFECGTNDMEAILDILTEEDIKQICDKYNYGKVR